MATTPDPSRRSDRARDAIFSAARALTAEVGYQRVSIEAIAARAGVGKQTIYRWWPSKGAVVFDAILDASTGPAGDHALPDTGDLRTDLKTVMRAVVAELSDPAVDRLNRAVTAEIQHDEALAGELVRRLLRPQLDATAQRLDAARRAGQIADTVDLAIAVEMLFGPVFHRWLLRTGPLDDAYADGVVEATLGGLDVRT
jgi:AcrR family transcriptional regulator